jgi:flavin reductase (DIM6/NTAB) family NADH-FMN oxidoreductase RutF
MGQSEQKPKLDREQFSGAVESVRSGLYIVTTMIGAEAAGCTTVWVSRVSFAPPLFGVVLSPQRFTYRAIEQSKRFCINVLGEDGLSLARQFGFHNGPPGSKFKDVEWTKSPLGNPLLSQAVSWFDCELREVVGIGDHKLLTGEVVAAGVQRDVKAAIYAAESFFDSEKVAGAAAGA